MSLPVGISPATAKSGTNGLRKHLTLQNVGILALLLFQAGQLWEGQKHTNSSLSDEVKETRELVKALDATTAATFVRKDVLSVELAAIRAQLASIESAIRGGK